MKAYEICYESMIRIFWRNSFLFFVSIKTETFFRIDDIMCLLCDIEEEDEEEFLESLPTDMMEEEDLEEFKAMAQKASFLTRDLSSWYDQLLIIIIMFVVWLMLC